MKDYHVSGWRPIGSRRSRKGPGTGEGHLKTDSSSAPPPHWGVMSSVSEAHQTLTILSMASPRLRPQRMLCASHSPHPALLG